MKLAVCSDDTHNGKYIECEHTRLRLPMYGRMEAPPTYSNKPFLNEREYRAFHLPGRRMAFWVPNEWSDSEAAMKIEARYP